MNAIPIEVMMKKRQEIAKRLVKICTGGGFVIMGILLFQPLLEGLSGFYTRSNEPLSSSLLTTAYLIWTIVLIAMVLAISVPGFLILKYLSESKKFHKEQANKSELQRTQRTLTSVCFSTLPLLALGCIPSNSAIRSNWP